jgi:hypothetical protein
MNSKPVQDKSGKMAKLAKSVPVSGNEPAIATTSAMTDNGTDASLPVVNPEDFTLIGVQVSSTVLEALEDRIDAMKDELVQGSTRSYQPVGSSTAGKFQATSAGGVAAPRPVALQPLLQMLAGGQAQPISAGAIDLTGD